LFILFDSEHAHCGDCFWSTLLTKCPVFTQSYLPKCAHVLDTALLIVITLKPNLTVRWVEAKAWRRLGGQSRCKFTALTMLAMGSKVRGGVEGSDDERMNEWAACPGSKIPSVQRSTQVTGKFGMSMPQSSSFFLTCVLKLKHYMPLELRVRKPLWYLPSCSKVTRLPTWRKGGSKEEALSEDEVDRAVPKTGGRGINAAMSPRGKEADVPLSKRT
jgi:hypothetical protein